MGVVVAGTDYTVYVTKTLKSDTYWLDIKLGTKPPVVELFEASDATVVQKANFAQTWKVIKGDSHLGAAVYSAPWAQFYTENSKTLGSLVRAVDVGDYMYFSDDDSGYLRKADVEKQVS